MADKRGITGHDFHGLSERLPDTGIKFFRGDFYSRLGRSVFGGFPIRGAGKGQKVPKMGVFGENGPFAGVLAGFWVVC
jgi:hypothetical protein